jgi:hypothetical protein
MFLGWGTRVGWLTVGIKSSFVADANGVSVVTAGMSTNHLIRATLVQLTVLRDVVVIAGTFVTASTMAGSGSFSVRNW